jgi:Tfp pilus assembly protein PilF
MIEEAHQFMPRDSLINQQHRFIHHQKFIAPHREQIEKAMQLFNSRSYEQARELLNEYIEKVPEDPNAFRIRALSNYYLNRHQEAIPDINRFFRTI